MRATNYIALMKADILSGALNPRDAKLKLARELAARFHDAAAADQAIAGWHAVVRGEGDTSLLPLSDIVVPAEGLRLGAGTSPGGGLSGSQGDALRCAGNCARSGPAGGTSEGRLLQAFGNGRHFGRR